MDQKNVCLNCENTDVVVTRRAYRFLESGLNNVMLINVEISECNNCGEKVVSIPNP